MLDPTAAPGHSVPNIEFITEETLTLICAGYHSTAIAMVLSFVYNCRDPEFYSRLVAEIDCHLDKGSKVSLKQMRTWTCLNAAVKKHATSSEFALTNELKSISSSHTIDFLIDHKRTIIQTSAFLMNRDPAIWGTDANVFKHSRWLDKTAVGLDR
ncbi:MAG: hypothetical protein Q9163_005120 [Psora crenata]